MRIVRYLRKEEGSVADKELEQKLFNKWRSSKRPSDFQQLYGSMKNLIYDAARKASYGSNIPESAHRIYAAQNFHDALRTFKPGKGASLQTHVWGAVHQKAKRLNYLYQNLGHIPEPRAQSIGVYQNEYEYLKDRYGREPSAAELADRLGWSLQQVKKIQLELRKDLALAEGTEEHAFFEGSRDEEILDYLYFDLGPEEKVVYDYIFGKHGKPRMLKPNNKIDFDRIGMSTGFSTSKVRNVFTKIRSKLERALKK